MFGHHAGPPGLRKQSAPQKIPEERMQSVFSAARVSGERDEDVAADQRRQNRRTALIRIEPHAHVLLGALQQREAEQQFLRRRSLKIEDLFGEVIEDVSLGSTQYFVQIGRGDPPSLGWRCDTWRMSCSAITHP